MSALQSWAKPICWLLVYALALLQFPVGAAQASIVGTESALDAAGSQVHRDRIHAFLAREEVRAQLVAWGVDPAEAQARADALSDREAKGLAERLDGLTAGQNVVGPIVGGIVLIFLVLLFTDLMGWTNIFPFVKKAK